VGAGGDGAEPEQGRGVEEGDDLPPEVEDPEQRGGAVGMPASIGASTTSRTLAISMAYQSGPTGIISACIGQRPSQAGGGRSRLAAASRLVERVARAAAEAAIWVVWRHLAAGVGELFHGFRRPGRCGALLLGGEADLGAGFGDGLEEDEAAFASAWRLSPWP